MIKKYLVFYGFLLLGFISRINAFVFTYKPNVNKNKLITFAPGGLTGFYTLGITSYIKDNYNLTNYSYLGASAGSWNALLLTYKKNTTEIIDHILSQGLPDIYSNTKSVPNLLNNLKYYVEDTYTADDFELNKLYVSVYTFKYFSFKPRVIYNFTSLTDATNGCYFSSYIPFITGNIKFFTFNNLIFDGGMGKFPPNHIDTYFDIHTSMWGRTFTNKDRFIYPNDPNYFKTLYTQGYYDSQINKDKLDLIFPSL